MKAKIKVKVLALGCLPIISNNGDWIDLKSSIDFDCHAAQSGTLKNTTIDSTRVRYRDVTTDVYKIPLGIAVKLPDGYEAIVGSRSSSSIKLNMFIPNGIGIIDNSYSGNNDEWNYIMSPLKAVSFKVGDRICQFRIQLSQKATIWQKIKWLFTSGIEIVEVKDLGNKNRGGLGSTGVN